MFINEFIKPYDKPQLMNLFKLMVYIHTIPNFEKIIYDIKINSSSFTTSDHVKQMVFDNNFVSITPRLFGEYFDYDNINHEGVNLSQVHQCALTNCELNDIGIDWKLFDNRLHNGVNSSDEIISILPKSKGYPKIQIYNSTKPSRKKLVIPVYQIYDEDDNDMEITVPSGGSKRGRSLHSPQEENDDDKEQCEQKNKRIKI